MTLSLRVTGLDLDSTLLLLEEYFRWWCCWYPRVIKSYLCTEETLERKSELAVFGQVEIEECL